MACVCQFALAADPLPPDATVAEFYKWYVHTLTENREPLLDERAKFSTYVSKILIEQIEQHMVGCGSDYIIKAQDYFDDWETNISAKTIKIKGNSATVELTLGATKDSYQKMTVALRKEDQLWKIRSIKTVADEKSK